MIYNPRVILTPPVLRKSKKPSPSMVKDAIPPREPEGPQINASYMTIISLDIVHRTYGSIDVW